LNSFWKHTIQYSANGEIFQYVRPDRPVLPKDPALKDVAPTQNAPPFKFTQLVVLVAFIALGIGAAIRFRAEPASPVLEAKG